MHLKSLTLKGFKSFASSTTLKLEPGICAVVGPNGSGKSNVVDALAWVMGEQGAKTLRGGKMEDVIFAGAGDRKPLGRAEVTLTIDNSDGKLPIEYSEVSVTRRMFRDGASEYEINGAKARLMDIQELLSDSGIGREMHVIVGQGRLSQILESKPEERRAFIEEAAGVLKHRRRKEKAQRKLVGMQANLDRLQDLTEELRRQLGPLARQAEAAQRASTVQATIRQARVNLAAHQVRTLSTQLQEASVHAERMSDELSVVQEDLEEHSEELAITEEELRTALEEAESARTLWYRLSAVMEKNSASLRIASDRAQQTEESSWTGPDPTDLLERAERADAEQAELDEAVEFAQEKLDNIRDTVAEKQERAREAEREHMAQVRAIADRREGVVRLLAQQEAAQDRMSIAAADVERNESVVAEQAEILEDASGDVLDASDELSEVKTSSSGMADNTEQFDREVKDAEARAEDLRNQERALEREIAALEATIAGWRERMRPTDGAALASTTAADLGYSVGTLAEHVRAKSGWAPAFAAVVGAVAPTGVVTAAAEEVIAALEGANEGRALILDPELGDASESSWRLDADLPVGQWLLDLLFAPDNGEIPAGVGRALNALLVDVVAVEDIAAARRVVDSDARLRAVTKAGTLCGPGWVAAGQGGAAPAVELAEKISDAQGGVLKKNEELADLKAALEAALDTAAERRAAAASARSAAQEQRATIAAAEQRLKAAENSEQAAKRAVERATVARDSAEKRFADAEAELQEVNDRLARVEEPGESDEPSTAERDRTAQELTQIRAMETEARLDLRTAEERAGATRGKADNLRRQARQEEAARKQHEVSRARRAAKRKAAEVVRDQAQRVGRRIEAALATAQQNRTVTDQTHKQWQATMQQQKQKVGELNSQLGRMTNAAHEAELARNKAQLKLEQAVTTAMEQLTMTTEQLLAVDLPEDFDMSAARKELKQAERDLNSLGKVNPLALEEYKALEERYSFLASQLDDVERAREDLQDVIKDVDQTILDLFTEAWKDVEAEFPKVFDTLFPDGSGRLVLTEPDDMLTTGIEVEARPPGKKVKRLSLLSGGEKSLTALALLVAIFRARPSPFYVMDEVEAALDDVNLRRLIALFEELRKDSQLIVITHQKPTMDVANVLYGVTMRGDGVTRVLSQRMKTAS